MRRPLRFKRKKKRVSFLRHRLFWYGTGLLFLLIFLFHVVVFSPWLEIKEVEVQGASEIPTEHILFAVERTFWQEFLGIPQNSILLVRTAVLKENLLDSFPGISEVAVKRSLPRTLVVYIQEREQIGTWCLPLQADRKTACFAIDAKGVPFKEVEEQDNYVVFSSKGEPTLGKELLVPSLLSALLGFKERFQEAGESFQFSITAFEIGERGEVQGVTKEGWRILLDLRENMEWQQTKLQLVLEQKIPLEKRGELTYIDLRFGDQAYIKYQD